MYFCHPFIEIFSIISIFRSLILGQGRSQLYLGSILLNENEENSATTSIFKNVNVRQVGINTKKYIEMKFEGKDVENINRPIAGKALISIK